SEKPEHIAVLQISSSLRWESIRLLPTVSNAAEPAAASDKEKNEGRLLQYLVQPYTSDIDHTGELKEAIVTLPADVPPQGKIQLEVSYSGIIEASIGRWYRVGMSKVQSARNDWVHISSVFTAFRGFGFGLFH